MSHKIMIYNVKKTADIIIVSLQCTPVSAGKLRWPSLECRKTSVPGKTVVAGQVRLPAAFSSVLPLLLERQTQLYNTWSYNGRRTGSFICYIPFVHCTPTWLPDLILPPAKGCIMLALETASVSGPCESSMFLPIGSLDFSSCTLSAAGPTVGMNGNGMWWSQLVDDWVHLLIFY